ncbi:MAG: hypothetical protein HYX92_09970 [Chloroflexi bacterium]|nr:hypothetical protein [Chloroflexota bacterium]
MEEVYILDPYSTKAIAISKYYREVKTVFSRWGKWHVGTAGIILLAFLASSGIALSQQFSQSWPPVQVTMSASGSGDSILYSVTLKNVTSSDVVDIFVAGSLPQGAAFVAAANTPAGSWFRGFEAADTDIQAAVWLASRLPAGGSLGPFVYAVGKGQAADLNAHAWVHFRQPADGTAVSADADPTLLPPWGIEIGGRFHVIHADRLALTCNTCHGARAADYADPLAQVSNPVDKTACLACHQSGGPRPFYGQ